MKKLMFLLAAASFSSVAFAQQSNNSQNAIVGESVDVMQVPVDKYKVETNRFFDNWFFSVGGGAQVLFGDQASLGKFSKRIAPALQVSVGKWFTPGLGLRLQYSGLQSKSFSREPSPYSKPHMLSEGYYQDKFNYMNLHGDILFNVSNMFGGYNPDRVYDLVPFLGFGFTHAYNDDAPRRHFFAFNFGLINTFHIADAWDLNLELYGMGAENQFDGKTFTKGLDVMLGATVGITYKFPQRGFKPAPDVDAIMALTSSQMDAINAALAQQIEQNRQLKAQLANTPNEVVTEQVTVNQIVPAPQSVFFQIGSAALPPKCIVNLQQVANLVKDNPGMKLKVTGYADSDTGSATWNKQLSEDRANNVANELVKLGVNKSNLIISGMGGVNTLTPPSFNRRVIIEAQ
ncbi:OmpA family protein [Bacteroidaceae bacterium]